MQIQGKACRVSIYIGEDNRYHGKPLYMAILEFLKQEGAAGATVLRGIAGFGARSRIHSASIVTLSTDLPIRLEWIDLEERVSRLMPSVRKMVSEGLITVETVDVVQYAAGRQPDPLEQLVHDVMRTEVVTLASTATLEEAISLIVQRGYRSLPVVDEAGHLVGILTDGDLLRRTNLNTRLAQRAGFSPEQMQQEIANLHSSAQRVADVMTRPVVTADAGETLRAVAMRMVEGELKRLPVIDREMGAQAHGAGEIVGVISRLDILRVLEHHASADEASRPAPRSGTTISELMNRTVPAVGEDARLEEIVQALETSQQQRVIVVDSDRHVLGIITDGDLLKRSNRAAHPDLRTRLWNLLTRKKESVTILPDSGETARQLMSAPVETVRETAPPEEALNLMLTRHFKRLPVVDGHGHLLGLLGRASVLRGLLERDSANGSMAPG